MPSKIRDIADILGVTEDANTGNIALASIAAAGGSGVVIIRYLAA